MASPPIWQLKKTLDGLKRAPKAFYDQLAAYLEEIGYTRSANDRCLLHRRFADGKQIMFCIHMDDFAVAASDNSLIDDLVTALKLKYIIKESESRLPWRSHGASRWSSSSQSTGVDQETHHHCGASRQQAICANSYAHRLG